MKSTEATVTLLQQNTQENIDHSISPPLGEGGALFQFLIPSDKSRKADKNTALTSSQENNAQRSLWQMAFSSGKKKLPFLQKAGITDFKVTMNNSQGISICRHTMKHLFYCVYTSVLKGPRQESFCSLTN